MRESTDAYWYKTPVRRFCSMFGQTGRLPLIHGILIWLRVLFALLKLNPGRHKILFPPDLAAIIRKNTPGGKPFTGPQADVTLLLHGHGNAWNGHRRCLTFFRYQKCYFMLHYGNGLGVIAAFLHGLAVLPEGSASGEINPPFVYFVWRKRWQKAARSRSSPKFIFHKFRLGCIFRLFSISSFGKFCLTSGN